MSDKLQLVATPRQTEVYRTIATILMRVNQGLAADQFSNPGNPGEAALPNFIGRSSSLACGAVARVSLQVDDKQRIVDAKFKVAGCTVLVTALSAITQRVKNATTAEAAALAEDLDTIEGGLGPEAAGRGDCVLLASEALLEAIRAYSDSARDHWNGDDALICTCFGVSERTIENEIQSKQLDSIAAVTRACNAGAGCRSCYQLIEDILEEVNRKL
jgi:NifU-like protein